MKLKEKTKAKKEEYYDDDGTIYTSSIASSIYTELDDGLDDGFSDVYTESEGSMRRGRKPLKSIQPQPTTSTFYSKKTKFPIIDGI
jgi:hypothetical protein